MKRGARTLPQPDQQVMGFILPQSDWVPPTELPDLRGRGRLVIDTENKDDGLATGRGPGWVYRAGHIAGISITVPDRSVYVPMRHPDTANFDPEQVGRWVEDHVRGGDRVIFQNAPYDLGWMLAEWDIKPPTEVDDTMALAYTVDEQLLDMSLDGLCRWQGIAGKDESVLRAAAAAYGMDPKKDLWRLPARFVGPYGEQDGRSTLALFEKLDGQLDAADLRPAYRLEADLVPLVLEMRRRGIRMDVDQFEPVKAQLLGERDAALAELSRLLATTRRVVTIEDLNSPLTMQRMFEEVGEPFPHTEKGNPSFQTDWMEKREHFLPRLATRALKAHDAGHKFVGQYIQQYCHLGRIHAEIHQYRDERGGTRTSRLAYSNPPLQQMPSRDPRVAGLIRSLFLPEEGEVWAAPDYSQQELRLMVHFSILCKIAGVEEVAARYRNDPNTDYHEMTSEITRLPRRAAKDVTFAKAFGAGVPKFAAMTGLPLEEARATMEQYDRELPFIKRLSEFSQARAQSRGYLRLLDGARTRFDRWEPRYINWTKMRAHMIEVGWPDMPTAACSREEALARTRDPRHFWYQERIQRAFTHKAMNSLIQGSAARQTKLAMRACWREGIVPVLQMHDELSASVATRPQAERMRELMIDVVKLEIPVRVDLEYGDSWGTAKVVKDENKRVVYGATWDEAWDAVQRRAA